MWLEKYLKSTFTGTLVVVSHDRHFLNEVVTDVVHFHNNTLATYRGDITNFEAVVQENKIRQKRQREQQEAKRAHLQKYIDIHAQAGENGPKVRVCCINHVHFTLILLLLNSTALLLRRLVPYIY